MVQCWILLLSVQLYSFRGLHTKCNSKKLGQWLLVGGTSMWVSQLWASLLPHGYHTHVGTAGCGLTWLAGEVLRRMLEILTTVFVLGQLIPAQLFLVIIYNSSCLKSSLPLGPWHNVGRGRPLIPVNDTLWVGAPWNLKSKEVFEAWKL